MKKFLTVILGLTMLLTACGKNVSSELEIEIDDAKAQDEVEYNEIQNQSVIYIGMNGEFSEYPVTHDLKNFNDTEKTELYVESLIDEMSILTGWDLDCDISVYKTVGVAFVDGGTLFTEPPEVQKEEFHMFSAEQMVQTILDSVKKTIQMNLGAENADLIEVYFSSESIDELIFPNINMYVPIDEAYTGLIPIAD